MLRHYALSSNGDNALLVIFNLKPARAIHFRMPRKIAVVRGDDELPTFWNVCLLGYLLSWVFMGCYSFLVLELKYRGKIFIWIYTCRWEDCLWRLRHNLRGSKKIKKISISRFWSVCLLVYSIHHFSFFFFPFWLMITLNSESILLLNIYTVIVFSNILVLVKIPRKIALVIPQMQTNISEHRKRAQRLHLKSHHSSAMFNSQFA